MGHSRTGAIQCGRVGVRVGHERSSGVVVCRHVSHGEE